MGNTVSFSEQDEQQRERKSLERRIRKKFQLLRLPPSHEKQSYIQHVVKDMVKDSKKKGKFIDDMNVDEYIQGLLSKKETQQRKKEQAQESKHKQYNPFINKLGFNNTMKILQKQINQMMEHFPQIKTIVSVGSGLGDLEAELDKVYSKKGMRMICIDPDPYSYNQKNFGKPRQLKYIPDFETVDQFLQHEKHKKKNVSDCLLFLNWPEVETHQGAGYDLEAIKKIKPATIIILFELFGKGEGGAAGSQQFHRYREMDKKYHKTVTKVFTHFDKDKYHIFLQHPEQYVVKNARSFAKQTFVMEYWERKDLWQGVMKQAQQLIKEKQQQPLTKQELQQKIKRQVQQELLKLGVNSSRKTRPGLWTMTP
jgi:hypothetical protein